MRTILAVLILAVSSQATPVVSLSPIPVTGSGWSLVSNHRSSDLSATVNGSNGEDFVNLTFTTMDDWGIAPFFCVCAGFSVNIFGSATIDGVTGPWVDFSIGNGTGHLNVYDYSHTIIASADLVGFVQVVSEIDGPGPGGVASGDVYRRFTVSPSDPGAKLFSLSTPTLTSVPEPSAFWLMIITLATLGIRKASSMTLAYKAFMVAWTLQLTIGLTAWRCWKRGTRGR